MTKVTRLSIKSHKDLPYGTKALAVTGGHWYRTFRGWKWNGPEGSGGTFPSPGGDWVGDVVLPTSDQSKVTILVDLDGTIANNEHRQHYIQKVPKDWDAFTNECVNDSPNYAIITLIRSLYHSSYQVIIVSGRDEKVKNETIQWLAKNNVRYDKLIMRKSGDFTEDSELKRSWLYDGSLPNKEQILLVLDDRKRVVDMWRSEGLDCLQVREADF